jgi:hypothetical protein
VKDNGYGNWVVPATNSGFYMDGTATTIKGGGSGNWSFGLIAGGFSGYFRISQNYDWNAQPGTWMFDRTSTNGNTSTSGNGAYVLVAGHFKPASGTATYSSIGITDAINQTGGANGITRGLYVNPTLTAAADWRGIESVAASNANHTLLKLRNATVDVLTVKADSKIGFWNATPVAQPTTAIAEATFTENSGGTAVNVDSTFAGYTLQQIAQALKDIGILQ